jgi:hypothetical protein
MYVIWRATLFEKEAKTEVKNDWRLVVEANEGD